MGSFDGCELIRRRRRHEGYCRHDHVEGRFLRDALTTSLFPGPAPVEDPVGYGAGEEGDDGGGDGAKLEPAEAHEQHDSAGYEGHDGPGAIPPYPHRERRAPAAQPVGAYQPMP